jgi:SagB-type dehydrogenase family enzyme
VAAPLAVIARRRSGRRYRAEPLGLQEVSAVLAAAGRAPAQLSAALRIDVLGMAVAGLPPAAWRYDPLAHALQLKRQHDDGLRRRARAAALEQDVVGDAALVCVLSIDRAALAAEPAGAARGYRHAFLEAGLAGERLYLEGVARGLGVCAVGAFYDDEAAALVDVDPRREWVVHLAALGRPA